MNYDPPKIVYVKDKRPPLSRPTYERGQDTDAEKKFAALCEQNSTLKVAKLKSFFPCDLALTHEKRIVGFIEFKRRFGAFAYPGGIFLSADKLSKIRAIASVTGVMPYFAVETAEAQYYMAALCKSEYPTVIGGRTDRNDAQDLEPVCLIEKRDFVPLVAMLQIISE